MLQTEVEPGLFARPGVYDGRKNLFTAYELPFESGGRDVSPSSHYSLFRFIYFPLSSFRSLWVDNPRRARSVGTAVALKCSRFA